MLVGLLLPFSPGGLITLVLPHFQATTIVQYACCEMPQKGKRKRCMAGRRNLLLGSCVSPFLFQRFIGVVNCFQLSQCFQLF
jgi:hypothetical protein